MEDVIYYNIFLILVIFAFSYIRPNYSYSRVIDVPQPIWAVLLVPFAVWCMASIPVVFGSAENDRLLYALSVIKQQQGVVEASSAGERAFIFYTHLVSLITDYRGWFYLTATIYIGNYCYAASRLTKEYMFVLFLSMLCCFQFFSYGTNTIRAGFAASFVVLAISFYGNLKVMIPLLLFAYNCHHSMLVPIGAMVLALSVKNTKLFLWGWFSCIIISFFAGNYFGSLFQGLVDDGRSSYFVANANTRYRVGFRYDFLLYSAIPVCLGYYYIFKLNCRSLFYQWLYRVYLTANGFWVLVIRANFTDRFAYLSWFIFPIVVLYPLLNQQLFLDIRTQRRYILYLMFFISIFGYYMRFK